MIRASARAPLHGLTRRRRPATTDDDDVHYGVHLMSASARAVFMIALPRVRARALARPACLCTTRTSKSQKPTRQAAKRAESAEATRCATGGDVVRPRPRHDGIGGLWMVVMVELCALCDAGG